MMKRILIFLAGWMGSLGSMAQDTIKGLTPQQALDIVRAYHPVAKQADLRVDIAKAELTSARGGFDPYLKNSSAQKTFDGSDYYYYNRPSLNIPTWFGIEIEGGMEYLSGTRTEPTETLGETSYFGVSVPLAKNLLMDKRRAALRSAQIYREASEQERRKMLNDLLFETISAYWDWARQYQVYQILDETVKVNLQRVELVKIAYRLGDRPAIDTTEAIAQLQNIELQRDQALLDFRNAALLLSTYFWNAAGQPYELPAQALPTGDWQGSDLTRTPSPSLDSLLQEARLAHPELRLYNYKLDVLAVEKKLKFQELLPTVNFRYNQLGKGYDILKTATGPLFENNFQYGLSLGIPLRLSEGRGEYRKAKLKITETEWAFTQKQLEISNKLKSYFNEWMTLQQQISTQSNAFLNYQRLQRAEELRFNTGESSLFLINARENKVLETKQKLVELQTKFLKTGYALQWAAGGLDR